MKKETIFLLITSAIVAASIIHVLITEKQLREQGLVVKEQKIELQNLKQAHDTLALNYGILKAHYHDCDSSFWVLANSYHKLTK